LEALERAHALLDAGRPLREGDFDDGALSALRGFALLTLKPWVVVANVAEDGGPAARAALGEEAVAVAAALEAEVAEMDPAESTELLAGFGISEPGVERVVAGCYRALDLITFLTADEKEAHAWQVRRGAKAPEAAGVIHSDFERGFIRAEVVSYEDLARAGSRDAARSKGWLRVEGKDYVVVEGDVLRVRFSL
jgi:ribosome-binding ATPase YchF (GTP1/OBG family)